MWQKFDDVSNIRLDKVMEAVILSPDRDRSGDRSRRDVLFGLVIGEGLVELGEATPRKRYCRCLEEQRDASTDSTKR